jgi:phage repressor protein C with HTH and peptisase S24 domain
MHTTVHVVPHFDKGLGTPCAGRRGTRRAMSIYERLRKAREARFPSSAEAAEAYGFNPNTLRSNENGNKPFGRDAAVRYASAFGVRLEWLLSGRGTMRDTRRLIPVEGFVGAGAAVFPIDDGAFEPIEPPFGCPDDAVAFVVRGDSMYPAYREGTFLIAQPTDDIHKIMNARAVVTLEDGRRYVKDIGLGSQPGLYTLYSHNAPPIPDVRIAAAARVIGTKEPH